LTRPAPHEKASDHAGEGRGKPLITASRLLDRRWGFRGLRTDVSGARGIASGGDPTGLALARLEAAVERLAAAASRPRGDTPGDMVPRAHVAAIADRLDETIARLRSALGEEH
jgi:hypothetical protein